MKNIILFLLTVLSFSCLNAQNKAELQNENDSLDYSLGVFVGNWMVNNGFIISNLQIFNQGMADLMNGDQRAITDSTIVPLIANYQLSIQNERNKLMEEQLFTDLRGKHGVGALPNGVHYIVIKKGGGPRPAASDSIVFNAIGLFPDGTVFENTIEKGMPITNVISNLIPGLNEAMQLMKEGAVWRIFVPSSLGYGTAGLKTIIPPNMALVYEITLEEVNKSSK